MELRFPESEICQWAKKYKKNNPKSYKKELKLIEFKPKVEQHGCLDKEKLFSVADWKSPRSIGHIDKNDPNYVKEITSWAFSATNERSRIEVLTLLDGVREPTASAILHLFHKDRYPILDFRALWSVRMEGWSVGVEDTKPSYSFECWWKYVLFCRKVACQNQVGMRTLDRALWQYSKCNQPKSVQ